MTAQRRDIEQIIEALACSKHLRDGLKWLEGYITSLEANLRSHCESVNTPFSEWLRSNPRLDSKQYGLSIHDVDWVIHQYRCTEDKNGRRTVNNLMIVEEKRHGVESNFAQRDTLLVLDQALGHGHKTQVKTAKGDKVLLRYYGLHILGFSGSGPVDSDVIRWDGREISKEQLEEIVRFDLDPRTLKPVDLRRHHMNKQRRLCLGYSTAPHPHPPGDALPAEAG